jgi:PAS domain S-box-containing protein
MSSARILIVEDETIVAMDLAATLRRLGYAVIGMVGTGTAAIEWATTHQPDLILMDIRLKGPMDGIEAATTIHRTQQTPVVFLTAHGDLDTVQRAKAASPYGYLVKPFDERALHRILEVSLHRAHSERNAREATLDALWSSEEQFRLLVNAVTDFAIFMLDTDARIATWNPGAERMTGYSENEVTGMPLKMLVTTDAARAADLEEMLKQVRERGSAEWNESGIRKDGTRYEAHMYCASMHDRNGRFVGYVSITRDETEKRKLEAQLIQSQRLQSLGQLAGGVAHDFNNMLMVIFARCELLLRNAKTEREQQFIRDIRTAATKNRDLTQQLLAAARQQILEPTVLQLNDVVESVVQLLGKTLGENIVIRTHLDDNLWTVYADATKLHQVLMNLSINARDAMPNGGTVTMETRNVKVDASYARQHVGLRPGDYVSVVVSDTGTGIPKELRDRIFDPFFTTKEPGRGSGLGLAVVRGIVEQMSGSTWMYSEVGRGTTFRILLPRNGGEAVNAAVEEETEPERGSGTILLVEDEPLVATVIREVLEEHGYQVLEARTPAAALEISDTYNGTIDLLLTDVIMPAMSGDELAARLVSRRPNVRVIFMSGYSNRAAITDAARRGSLRYLEKPIPTNVLLRSVHDALHEQR